MLPLFLLLAAGPTRWPIQSLSVDGAKNYSPGQILAASGLKTGQLAGKPEFEAARDRLVATGRFETVGYKFGPAASGAGYAATFQVAEVDQVYPARFMDLGASAEELHAALKRRDPLHGAKIPATAEVLARYARVLEEITHQTVAAKLMPEGPGEFSVIFRPAARAPVVAEVVFRGNNVLPSEALQNSISGVAFGREYTEPTFRQLLDSAIRPLYEARGRIRVAFPRIETRKAKSVEGLLVTVEVEEGESYTLGAVRATGSGAVGEKELLKAADWKPGETANFDEVAAGLERIRRVLRRQGYMRADASTVRIPDDAKKSVDLVIQVTEGPQFLFGKLTLEGLDIHGEAEVRKLWGLKADKPFNADYPDFFLNRVREDNLFEGLGKTRAKSDVDEPSRLVDVTLVFDAASTEPGATLPTRRASPRR